MALIAQIFNKPKPAVIQIDDVDGDKKDFIVIDSATVISHEHDAEVTENPVESGARIVDHYEEQPKKLTIEGVISEAPIKPLQAGLATVGGAVATFSGIRGGLGGAAVSGGVGALSSALLGDEGDRVKAAMDSFEELEKGARIVTIITGLRVYDNMVLVGFKPVERKDHGDSLVFTANFSEVVIAASELVLIPALADDVSTAATPTQNLGKKQSSAEPAGLKNSNQTLLKRIFSSSSGG